MCVRCGDTHRWKFEVLLDEVEDVLDPVPVVGTGQLHWWCQRAHRHNDGLLHTHTNTHTEDGGNTKTLDLYHVSACLSAC